MNDHCQVRVWSFNPVPLRCVPPPPKTPTPQKTLHCSTPAHHLRQLPPQVRTVLRLVWFRWPHLMAWVLSSGYQQEDWGFPCPRSRPGPRLRRPHPVHRPRCPAPVEQGLRWRKRRMCPSPTVGDAVGVVCQFPFRILHPCSGSHLLPRLPPRLPLALAGLATDRAAGRGQSTTRRRKSHDGPARGKGGARRNKKRRTLTPFP